MPSTEKDLAEDALWKKIQQNTFTRWCNEHLKASASPTCSATSATAAPHRAARGAQPERMYLASSTRAPTSARCIGERVRGPELSNASTSSWCPSVSAARGRALTRGWPTGTGCSGLGGALPESRGRAEGGGPGTGGGSLTGSPEPAHASPEGGSAFTRRSGRPASRRGPRGHPAPAVPEPSSFSPRTLLANLLLPPRLLF